MTNKELSGIYSIICLIISGLMLLAAIAAICAVIFEGRWNQLVTFAIAVVMGAVFYGEYRKVGRYGR